MLPLVILSIVAFLFYAFLTNLKEVIGLCVIGIFIFWLYNLFMLFVSVGGNYYICQVLILGAGVSSLITVALILDKAEEEKAIQIKGVIRLLPSEEKRDFFSYYSER